MADETERRLSSLFAGGAILFAGVVIQLGIGFLAKLVIARELGRVDFGAVALGTTLLTTVTVVVLIGTDTGIGRYLPRFDDPAKRRGVLTSAFQVVVPIAAAVGVVLFLAADLIAVHLFTDPSTAPVIRVFSLAVPLYAVVKLTVGSIRGLKESTPRVYLQNIALPVSRFTLIAVAVLLGLGVMGVAWAYTLSYALVAALSVVYLVYRTPLFDDVAPNPMHREMLTFSAPLMVTATMTILFGNADTFIIGYFASTGEVGVYNVAYPLASLLVAVLNSFGFIFMPAISELHANDNLEEMRRTFELVSKWIFVTTLPLFLLFVSYPDYVIRFTFGTEYLGGQLALAILAIGFFTHSIAGPSGNTLVAIGRPERVMYTNITVVLVNVVLNFYLVPRYGIVGAAIATTVGYAVMNALFLFQLHRQAGVHPFRTALLRPAIVGTVAWGVIYLGSTFLHSTPPTAALVLALFGLAYPIVLLRFGGVEPEDAMLVDRIEEKLGVNLDSARRVARVLIG